MKITKGQLKRIIAEEHALVYGKPKRKTSKRNRNNRRRLQERKLLEARKRDLLVEEFMMNEGMFSKIAAGLSGLFGGEGGIADQVGGTIEKVATSLKNSKDKAMGAMNKAIEAQEKKEQAAALQKMKDSVDKAGGGAFYEWASEHLKKKLLQHCNWHCQHGKLQPHQTSIVWPTKQHNFEITYLFRVFPRFLSGEYLSFCLNNRINSGIVTLVPT